jgi:hypothetical protein
MDKLINNEKILLLIHDKIFHKNYKIYTPVDNEIIFEYWLYKYHYFKIILLKNNIKIILLLIINFIINEF